MGPPTVFVSYSHKDEDWKDRLLPQLRVLELEEHIKVWDDRQIDGGDTWYPEIKEAMAEAEIAVLLISAHFLSSPFIRDEEVPYLLERRAREGMTIIPVLLRPCPWSTVDWLKNIQMLPRDGKSVAVDFKDEWDTPFAEVAELIFEILNDPNYEPPAPPPPTWLAPEKVDIARLPETGVELFGRSAELALLDQAWEDDATHIVSLVAWGGVGKSTLVNRWLERVAADNYRGAVRVFAWSFYSQGTGERVTSADQFVAAALDWFGDDDPAQGSPWAKGERLAELVRQQRSLLLLDGMEPLQSPSAEERGKVKDPALATLLTELARDNTGLCVITTRETVSDLVDFSATVRETDLEQISAESGRALLRVGGVRGMDAALEAASRAFGNHALALNLLAAYLHDIAGHDVSLAEAIPDLDIPDERGRHPRRVMAAFAARFGDGPEVDILRMLGLFDRPAEAEAIAALRTAPAIPDLTTHLQDLSEADWMRLLENLSAIGLVAPASQHNRDILDAHPLVREHFGQQLRDDFPDAWREGNSRLYEHYKEVPAQEYPDTLEALAPLYAAVAHGCAAGRHQEAFDGVHWKRIRRGREFYITKKLGAFGNEVAALSGYFDRPWHRPVAGLNEVSKPLVLNLASFALRSLGRLLEAMPLQELGLEIDITREDWNSAAISARNVSQLSLLVGNISQGIAFGRTSVELADQSGNAFERMGERAVLAGALVQAGRAGEAGTLFREAESIQKEMQPEYPRLYSYQGFLFCELLFDQDRHQEVQDRATQAIKIATQNNWLLDIGLDHLALGRAHMAEARQGRSGDFLKAEDELNLAVDGLRRAASLDHIPNGLLARAALHRLKNDFAAAHRDLNEASTIAERGQMRLHQADARLELTRLHLATGARDQARSVLAEAKAAIKEMGYHRRDKAVAKLTAALADG